MRKKFGVFVNGHGPAEMIWVKGGISALQSKITSTPIQPNKIMSPRWNSQTSLLGTVLVATAAFSSTSHAALTVVDQFLTGPTPSAGQYATGSVTGQNPTVTGFTGAWTRVGNDAQVTGSGLTFSNGSGTVASAGGALTAVNGTRGYHSLTSTITDSTSGIFYMSVLLKLNNTDSGAYRAFELFNGGTADANRRLSLGAGPAANFGSTTNFGFKVNETTVGPSLGAVDASGAHLFVMKFDLSATAGADKLTVWQDPANLGSEAGSGAGATLSGFNMAFDRVALSSFVGLGSSTITGDELRMATTWQDVTTVPEPSAALLGGLGMLCLLRRRRN